MRHTPLSAAEYARLCDLAQRQAQALRREAMDAFWNSVWTYLRRRGRQVLRRAIDALPLRDARLSH